MLRRGSAKRRSGSMGREPAAAKLAAALAVALAVAPILAPARGVSAHGAGEPQDGAERADVAAAVPAAIPAAASLATWRYNHDGRRGAYHLSDGRTGTNLADVQALLFDANSVFVRSTGIPSYDIGPFDDGNPNVPGEQGYVFRLPLDPVEADAPRATGLGNIGTFVNGVPMYNPLDDWSWSAASGRDAPNMGGMGGQRGDRAWNRNAALAERRGFDACLGHPARGRAQGGAAASGRYHHHIDPLCLRRSLGDTDPTRHSPIIGWAFDGYPLYGPYGYSNPLDAASPVRRMRSRYVLRDITTRTTRPDGSAVAAGPPVGTAFPLGWYVEDFALALDGGASDLDPFNGRFTVTPEFPAGTYAYFTTIDDADEPAYPYLVGPRYRGEVAADNIGPMARVDVPPGAATYVPPQGTAAPSTPSSVPPTATAPEATASPSTSTVPPPATAAPTAAPTAVEPTPTDRPAAGRCYLPLAARF